jgi:hypothetical protein
MTDLVTGCGDRSPRIKDSVTKKGKWETETKGIAAEAPLIKQAGQTAAQKTQAAGPAGTKLPAGAKPRKQEPIK